MNPVESPLHLPGPARLSATLRCWGRSTSPASDRFTKCPGRCSTPCCGGARRGTPEERTSGWGGAEAGALFSECKLEGARGGAGGG